MAGQRDHEIADSEAVEALDLLDYKALRVYDLETRRVGAHDAKDCKIARGPWARTQDFLLSSAPPFAS